jgi:hypothetical protein
MDNAIGRRVYPEPGGLLSDGEYGAIDGIWYCFPPGADIGNLSLHNVTEHDDGTITVSPSILITYRDEAGNRKQWHGFLECGVWRVV